MTGREKFNASWYLIDRQVEAGHGDRPAVTGPTGTRTYAQLAAEVHASAAGLRALGVRPEERVVLFCADRPELLAGYLGAMRMGAVPVPVSTMYRDTELAELLVDSRATAVLTSPEFGETARAAIALAGDVQLIRTDDVPAGAGRELSWSQLLADGEGHSDALFDAWPDSPAFWLYTSGTT